MRRRASFGRTAVTLIAYAAVTLAMVLAPPSSGPDRALAQEGQGGSAGNGGGGGAARNPGGTAEGPNIGARSWALVDEETGLFLAGENADERLPMASTTKIMVALLTLEGGTNLEEEVVISDQAERFVGGVYSNVGLYQGERLSVRELLVASLVPSGTEAVYALAEHLGGGGGQASVEVTVERMNRKADELNLTNTQYENPAGLDVRGHYTSARDLATVAHEAMQYRTFREIVAQQGATLTTQGRSIDVFNTNELVLRGGLYYPNATGIKTGTSPAAGPSLVASAGNGDGESYITVLLDARDDIYRFNGAQTALEYGFANFDRRRLVEADEVLGERQLPFRREESVGLAAAGDVQGISGPGLKVEERVTAGEPPASARAGQNVGTVEVLVDGQSVGNTQLVAENGYEEAGFLQKMRYRSGALIRGLSQRIFG